VPYTVGVRNARDFGGSEARTLTRHGFELLDAPFVGPAIDFRDHEQIVDRYYPDCECIVQNATGAAKVVAFDHNVRSASGKSEGARIAGDQQVQGPAQMVHGDYTLTSAPQRLRDLAEPPSRNDTYVVRLGGHRSLLDPDEVARALDGQNRYAIVNLWRNIAGTPVARHPLALCDAQTVTPGELVVFEIRYADRTGENYFARYRDGHRWYYYPAMTGEEALLIKQWDSAGPLARSRGAEGDATSAGPCTFSFHTAAELDDIPADAPERWSIEVRTIVLYDD